PGTGLCENLSDRGYPLRHQEGDAGAGGTARGETESAWLRTCWRLQPGRGRWYARYVRAASRRSAGAVSRSAERSEDRHLGKPVERRVETAGSGWLYCHFCRVDFPLHRYWPE